MDKIWFKKWDPFIIDVFNLERVPELKGKSLLHHQSWMKALHCLLLVSGPATSWREAKPSAAEECQGEPSAKSLTPQTTQCAAPGCRCWLRALRWHHLIPRYVWFPAPDRRGLCKDLQTPPRTDHAATGGDPWGEASCPGLISWCQC